MLHYIILSGISSNFSRFLITFIFIANFIDFPSALISRFTRVAEYGAPHFPPSRLLLLHLCIVVKATKSFCVSMTRPEGKRTQITKKKVLILVLVHVSDGKVKHKEKSRL